MTSLRVAPIVEGDGEVAAVGELLRRLGFEMFGGKYIDVMRPYLLHRAEFSPKRTEKLREAMNTCAEKMLQKSQDRSKMLILLMCDPEPEPTCVLGPNLTEHARKIRNDIPLSVVFADVEYESWFVAAAKSLQRYLTLTQTEQESITHSGSKSWVKRHMTKNKYSETTDQPKLTAEMDLALCRRNSLSFDKLCRELEKHLS